MSIRRQKVLFVAEAVTLAHVGRMLSLAEALDRTRFDAALAWDPRYRAAIGPVSLPAHEIWSVPGDQFFGALRRGARSTVPMISFGTSKTIDG